MIEYTGKAAAEVARDWQLVGRWRCRW